MSAIDQIKALITGSNPNALVFVQFGELAVSITASELGAALGVKPAQKKSVQVTSSPYLRIRDQPTTAGAEVGRINPADSLEYFDGITIKADNLTWGKLVDGRGWVALDFTTWNPANTVPQPATITSSTSASQVTSTNSTSTVPSSTTPIRPVFTLPFSASVRGVGTSAGGWAPDQNQLEILRRNHVEFVLVVAYEPGQAQNAIPMLRGTGVTNFIIRAAIHAAVGDAQSFIDQTLPILREYASALGSSQNMMIAVHNEVNLRDEGFGRGWNSGSEFAGWFSRVTQAYRSTFSGCKIGFPAPLPGGEARDNAGLVRFDEAKFIAACSNAIADSDWVGVHYYWGKRDGSDINPPVSQWRQWFGSKPVVITELGPTNANTLTTAGMRRAYQKCAEIGVPGAGFVLQGAGAWANADWTLTIGNDVI